jgi:uncharacterized membrane protein
VRRTEIHGWSTPSSTSALAPEVVGGGLPQRLKPRSQLRVVPAPLKRCSTRLTCVTLIPLALAGGAITVPWLFAHSPAFALALQRAFALVCHQQPERSFYLFGGTVAVCARCLGIYLGAAIGLLMRVPRRVAMQLLIVAVAVNAGDWLAELVGLHGNWMWARFALGITLGVTGAILVAASLYPRTACTSKVARIRISPA